ncbi:MAG: hypothetical protein GF350_16315 [Chitinivibrionales bacterium]|nr:hypothetical protein [Chitinivibrionales bacterium]
MKKSLFYIFAAVLLAGCTENKITIENDTTEQVYFNFRANTYAVAANTVREVSDEIPNGTYAYGSGHKPSTSTGIPINSGSGLSGTMTFNRHKTEQYILYWASFDSTEYTVNAVVSTSDPLSTVTQAQ